MFSRALKKIKPSATVRTASRVRELRAQGRDVISLCIGEPDFSTPVLAQEMAIQAIRDCDDNYSPVSGTAALREEIAAKFARDNALHYSPDEIVVSTGAKQVLYNVLGALLNPEDEVILIAPYWVSYREMVELFSAKPVLVRTTKEFRLDLDAIRGALNANTKAIVINSPSNPSGVCYKEQELRELAEILTSYPQVYVVSDDIYEHITYSNASFLNIANVAHELRERIIVVNGVSKCYAMTGWRIGYAAIPNKELMSLACKLQEHSTFGACTIAQAASIGALRSGKEVLRDRLIVFERKMERVVELLSVLPELRCYRPDGAFYLFLYCGDFLGKKSPGGIQLDTDSDVAEYLLAECSVAVVAGAEFGLPQYFRISYALPMELLERACAAMVAGFKALR